MPATQTPALSATADLTYAQYAVQNATPLPATYLATVADLRRGQWACLSATGAVLVRIRHADPQGRGTRVEWDHGHGTKATVRHMPSTNPVQVSF